LGIEVSQIVSTSNKLIDLYDTANSADLPGFWIIIICATFHWDGKKPHLRIALYSWDVFYPYFWQLLPVFDWL
jgi:hypothetical protein